MPIEFAPPQPNLQGFNVPPPQSTDPLQTLAQMGQLRTQNLQRQAAELQLQNEQMQMRSTQGLMRAYQEAGGDPVKMATLAPKYGVMPDHMMKIQQMLDEQANKRAQTKLYGSQADKDAMEALDKKHDALNEAYTPVFEEKDPAKQQVLLGQINQNLVNQGYDPNKDLIPPNSTPDAIQQAKHAYTTQNYIKTQAEAQEKAALAAQSKATTAKTTLETKQLQAQLDWMDGLTPQTLANYVGASIDKTKYPDLYARAYNDASNARAMRKPELMQAAIDKYATIASEQEKTIATETNPDVIKARVGQRVAEAQAVAPIETNRAVATAVATEKAKAALSPDVFNQIIDPTSRNRAVMETEKYTKEYITKMNDAQKMLDTVNAAQKGNQAASGLIPLEEVRSIVNRVNRQELEAVSGGGSLLRRVENMLSQATSGTMSAAQLKDLRALGELQKVGANRAYQGSRLGTKTIYGVMPPEVDLTGIITPAGGVAAGGGAGHVIQIGNKRYRYNGSGDTGDLKNYTEVK